VFAIADWQEEGKHQRKLKLAAVERWMLESRSKIQIPFRKWYDIADKLRLRWSVVVGDSDTDYSAYTCSPRFIETTADTNLACRYLWVADSLAKQHAQGLIADMMRRRWLKMRFQRIVQGWWGETEAGAESGRGREDLLSLLNEQRQLNTALEDSVTR